MSDKLQRVDYISDSMSMSITEAVNGPAVSNPKGSYGKLMFPLVRLMQPKKELSSN